MIVFCSNYFMATVQKPQTTFDINRKGKRKRKGIIESTILLRLMPPQVCMDMGKGYDNDDRLRRSSLSQRLMW